MTSLFLYSHEGPMPCPVCGVASHHVHEALTQDDLAELRKHSKVQTFIPSPFSTVVLAERQRQIDIERFTTDDDVAAYPGGELVKAAICYAFYALTGKAGEVPLEVAALLRAFWPWDITWFKPETRRRALVKAAALLLAEGDRQDEVNRRAAAEAEGELPESMR